MHGRVCLMEIGYICFEIYSNHFISMYMILSDVIIFVVVAYLFIVSMELMETITCHPVFLVVPLL